LALGTGQLAIAGGATLKTTGFINLSFANAVKLSGGVASIDLPFSTMTLSGDVSGRGALSTTGKGVLLRIRPTKTAYRTGA